MLGLSMMLVGILDVLGVVLALEVLDAGEQGVGLISGAIGAGGLLGAAIAISLVGRHRLLAPMLVAAAVIGLGIGIAAPVPVLGVVLVGFLAGGVGKSVYDVAGPDDAPARGARRDARPGVRRARGRDHGGARARHARGAGPRPAARHGGRARGRRPRSSR